MVINIYVLKFFLCFSYWKGTDKVKSIILNPPKDVEVQWSGNEFMNMTDLKMLVIRKACFSKRPKYLPTTLRWLEWEGYPFESLPNPACQTELVYLDLTKSYCKFLQQFDMVSMYTVNKVHIFLFVFQILKVNY